MSSSNERLGYSQQQIASHMAYFEITLHLMPTSYSELSGLPVSEKGEDKARRVLNACQGNILEMHEWRGLHDPIENTVRWRVSTSLIVMWERIAKAALEAIENIRKARVKAGDTQLQLFDMNDYLSAAARKAKDDEIPF